MTNQKPKKEVSDGYLAMTHFLTAGFAIPFLFGIILAVIIYLIHQTLGEGYIFSFIGLILSFVVSIIAIMLGIKYSHNFIQKRYIIKNAPALVKNSLIIFVVLRTFGIILNVYWGDTTIGSDGFILDIVILIVGAIIFYKYTKKYFVKSTIS